MVQDFSHQQQYLGIHKFESIWSTGGSTISEGNVSQCLDLAPATPWRTPEALTQGDNVEVPASEAKNRANDFTCGMCAKEWCTGGELSIFVHAKDARKHGWLEANVLKALHTSTHSKIDRDCGI